MSLKVITAALLITPLVVAAPPTLIPRDLPTRTIRTGVTHSVVAGLAGLNFDPNNVVAEVGDVVEWHFLPANHSVAQSSFGTPCQPPPGSNGFFPGFEFATSQGQSSNVFQIVVQDKNPIWYYCPQQNGNHCQNGMAGVINQNYNGDQTLSNYKAHAASSGTSVIPPISGVAIPNPNPNGGY